MSEQGKMNFVMATGTVDEFHTAVGKFLRSDSTGEGDQRGYVRATPYSVPGRRRGRGRANVQGKMNFDMGQPLERKKPRVDKRQYKKTWEEVPELQGWLTPSDGNPERAWCRYCRISLRAHRRDLVDHSLTERHMRNTTEALGTNNASNHGDDGDFSNAKDDASCSVQLQSQETLDFQADLDDEQNEETYPAIGIESDASGSERKPSIAALTRAVRNSQQQILVIQTGGTIDKDYPRTIQGYSFEIGDAAAQRIFDRVGVEVPIVSRTLCRKDSTQLTPDDRLRVYDCCANAPQQRVLITHGTDTLLDTAGYLSECGDLSSKIIVITGAMKPETFKDSDAEFNVGCALGAVQSISAPGVYVSMHGLVARWDQVERDSVNNKFVRKQLRGYF